MAKIYFAKMNINDEIYEVYNDQKKLGELLKKIYIGVSSKTNIYDDKGGRYKFFDLDWFENNSSISGRLGYIKKGVHSTYDPDTDQAIDIEDKNKIEYITFYFDVNLEMLAFTVTPVLTRNKILQVFSDLIKKETGIGIVCMLETDIRLLNAELKKMKVLRMLRLNLVPPNGDKEQFGSLFSLDAESVAESEATKIEQVYSNQKKSGLNKASKLIKNAINGIQLGYAKGRFFGKDNHENPMEVNTEKDAPYIKIVSGEQNKNKSVISEKGRAGIVELSAYKARIRENKKNETDKEEGRK